MNLAEIGGARRACLFYTRRVRRDRELSHPHALYTHLRDVRRAGGSDKSPQGHNSDNVTLHVRY